jgi:hypothetical protein
MLTKISPQADGIVHPAILLRTDSAVAAWVLEMLLTPKPSFRTFLIALRFGYYKFLPCSFHPQSNTLWKVKTDHV